MRRTDTNTTTYFLREARALETIRDLVVVPNAASGRRTSVWSLGCSTGDEPYGLAMLCREAGVEVDVLATDINPNVLAVAARGRYAARNLRHVGEARRARWFRRDGEHWEVAPEVRGCVQFAGHDVTREASPRQGIDVVVCRNVIVYFTPEELARAIATMVASLRPGGLIVLGASEWLRGELRAGLVPIERGGVIVYQREDEVRPAPAPAPAAVRPAPPPPPQAEPLADEVARLRAEGDALLDTGRSRDAGDRYLRALALAPLLADLHLRVARAHLHERDADAAREALRRALFLTPALWPAWLLLADLVHEPEQAHHCLVQAHALLTRGASDADAPELRPFAGDRRVALDAIDARLRRFRTPARRGGAP
jgi:chemotaxis protein methyltransferase CheR